MRRLLFLTAIFMLGVIGGAAFTSVLIGKQIDALYMENKTFQDDLLAADKQIRQLRESNQVKKRVISNISTHIEFEKNNYTDFEKKTIELKVEKNVREWLDVISGQDVNKVDCLLIPHIVDNREMVVDKRKMRLKVNMVAVSETVKVYIKVMPVNSQTVTTSRTGKTVSSD